MKKLLTTTVLGLVFAASSAFAQGFEVTPPNLARVQTVYACQSSGGGAWQYCDADSVSTESCMPITSDDNSPKSVSADPDWDCSIIVGGYVENVEDQAKSDEIMQGFLAEYQIDSIENFRQEYVDDPAR